MGLPYVRTRAQDYFEQLSGIGNDEIQLDDDGEVRARSLNKVCITAKLNLELETTHYYARPSVAACTHANITRPVPTYIQTPLPIPQPPP